MKKLSVNKQRLINNNIPYAMTIANLHVEKHCKDWYKDNRNAEWNKVYHSKMDKLCKKDGLRV